NATAHAIHFFTNAADSFTRTGTKATYNIGVLGGGTSVNAIPFESWMEVDLRSEDPERLQGLDQLLQQAIRHGLQEANAQKRMGSDLTADVKLVGDRPTGAQDVSLALVQRAAAASLQMGATPTPHVSSTNANIPISKGVPGITIWQGGRASGAHSLNEWWMNDQGHLAIQATLLLLLAEAGLAK
ncbi:MAG TPA: peptidase dimerization domain-containing protein, partial [Flavisolibacter sp.]|nr:peptidase dimerization domain-containing protein [Flavisolibacter sp.]